MAFTPLKAYPNNGTVAVAAGFPATIADGGTWNSILFPAGFGGIAVGVTSDHAGTLNVQRYADLAGLVPVGAVLTVALVAATPKYVAVEDGLPYVSFSVQIVNGAGAIANITNAAVLTGGMP